ncbi:hypothetical protein AVEN_2111-1 [Araneus ventricosus]|uniref:Uncharacterized protein n=1 Tax=Araneus ventricosus TaxID=182803 RepID=A0A4Y2JR89_ARAVE|nr:hypothetical protein AVEN_2111-1 [Araneus ventricosus]
MLSFCCVRWLAKESISRNQLSFRRCESQEKGCRLICRIWHPTLVQNYEVPSKMLSICNVRWLAKESIRWNQLSFRRCESQEKGSRDFSSFVVFGIRLRFKFPKYFVNRSCIPSEQMEQIFIWKVE